jgi:hypothetical protein
MRVAARIDIKEAPVSILATSPQQRRPSRPNHHSPSPHQHSQNRRPRRLDRKRRRCQTHKARTARRKLQRIHQAVPLTARSLFDSLAPGFTRPTFLRFVVLALAAILTLKWAPLIKPKSAVSQVDFKTISSSPLVYLLRSVSS